MRVGRGAPRMSAAHRNPTLRRRRRDASAQHTGGTRLLAQWQRRLHRVVLRRRLPHLLASSPMRFLTDAEPPQHRPPVGAAADRRGGHDLRHHDRRHRPFGRLGAGAGERAVGGLAADGHAMAAGRSSPCSRSARAIGVVAGLSSSPMRAFRPSSSRWPGCPSSAASRCSSPAAIRSRSSRRALSATSAGPGCSACRCRR